MARRSAHGVDWAALCREWRDSGLTQAEFCHRREIEPFTYLRDVLARVSTHPARLIAVWLPDRWRDRQALTFARFG